MEDFSDRIALLTKRLSPLEPVQLHIEDESHFHAGHAGARGGAGHYRVHIQSAQFNGLTRIQRQQAIYKLVADLIPFPIHALAIHATPTE